MDRLSRRFPLSFAQALLLPAALLDWQTAPPAAPTPAPTPCAASEYRQFDFWVGSWSVTDSQGKPAGANDIQSILAGCVVQENWVGADGMTGSSFNIYDAARKRWHQTWVDDRGQLLLLDGEFRFRDGKMVLEGRRPGRYGGMVRHRITWQQIDGKSGRVRQLWQTSRDDGKTWQVVFDGTYARKS